MGIGFADFRLTLVSLLIVTTTRNAAAVQTTTSDPMVAFICNKGAMHMDQKQGWRGDSSADCLESSEDILRYCRDIYPKLDVRNVVETIENMAISGWCPLGVNECKSPQTFTVQAYRCLSGEFQSDALVVPSDCKFDHIYRPDSCSDFNFWRDLVVVNCFNQSEMLAHSYGMLEPCGTDLWTGVEYVCCPSGEAAEETDAVSEYLKLKLQTGQYSDEHDAFELAKDRQMEKNKEKSDKMMEQWYKARASVVELQETDAEEAEKLSEEISGRFSREFTAMQAEGDAVMSRLDAVHQQRVQTNLNYKKRVSMQKLMEELQSDTYNIDDVSQLLQNYISIEQKDAVHSVKHFVKVRTRDPEAAKEMLPATIEHLFLISKRINQSIDILDTLPDRSAADRLKANTVTWVKLSSFNIDQTLELLESLPVPQERVTTSMFGADKIATSKAAPLADTQAQPDDKKASGNEDDVITDVSLQGSDVEGNVTPSDASFVDEEMIGVSNSMSTGAVIACASGVLTAMIVIVLAILIVKKKSNIGSKRSAFTYLEVSPNVPDLSPEDRHIVTMQNGYQNPTYALLEQKKL